MSHMRIYTFVPRVPVRYNRFRGEGGCVIERVRAPSSRTTDGDACVTLTVTAYRYRNQIR
jgi:hypothetical protein